MTKAVFISDPSFWQAGHGLFHPLKPERLKRTHDLLHAYHAFDAENSRLISPRMATDEELLSFHTPAYVDAVKRLSRGEVTVNPWRYNLGPGDNPVFPRMYETEALKVGGALIAAELVVSGQADVAFNYAGGLHHAAPDHAFGFCVFNDPAIAIHWLLRQGLRAAYIDIDVHHGDRVQNAFYDSDQVLTISLHESGRYLFPGTGFTYETGTGKGKGYAVNVPLPPDTDDESYVWAFQRVVIPLVKRFAPDVVVSQLGTDTHFKDPLAHLLLSSAGYVAVVKTIKELAPRWIALGGGGYDVTVVPRLWTLAYGVMSGQEFPDELPVAYAKAYEGGTLCDHQVPVLPESERYAVRRRVESVVAELEKMFQIAS